MKPNEISLNLEDSGRQNQNVILVQNPVLVQAKPIVIETSSNSHTTGLNPLQPTSPAADALDYLHHHQDLLVEMDDPSTMDPHNLIVDLNELLRRDPTLSSLEDKSHSQVNVITLNEANQRHANAAVVPPGVIIPSPVTPGNKASQIIDYRHDNQPAPPPQGDAMILKLDDGHDILGEILQQDTSSTGNQVIVSHESGRPAFDQASSLGSVSPSIWSNTPRTDQHMQSQPTLAQLNSPPADDFLTGTSGQSSGVIKMEVNDYDDLDALFMTNTSPNVTFGLPNTDVKPHLLQQPVQTTPLATSPSTTLNLQNPTTLVKQEQLNTTSTFTPLTNTNFWQANTDEMIFGPAAHDPAGVGGFTGGQPGGNNVLLSSSVPAIFHNPLSDILTELRSPNKSPNNAPSSSQVGPTRHSTLHRLLMQRKGDGGSPTGAKVRPMPVKSPEGRKTLEQMKSSLSTSSPLLSQQLLSRSAPNPAMQKTGENPTRNVWARREPRQHISSVCSVGETSSIADEVNDVLARLSPSDDLQDIASDDEDESGYYYQDDKDSSEDDSDVEGTSPSMSKLSTSAGSSTGKKGERHFWQYNVQAKGPKGQKIMIETKMEDPHVLNEIVDPVFSGDVQLQGIKHSGKARRGDGNDLTANPRKLAAIGKELDQLSRVINDMTPVSEMPLGARCKSRKEKNKLASRACRLKKKAQHEANKVKCQGLLEEHRDLTNAIAKVKSLLAKKMDMNCPTPQAELTSEIDNTVESALAKKVAGNTTGYVNDMIAKNLPYV